MAQSRRLLYKRGLFTRTLAFVIEELDHGSSEAKDIAIKARDAPFRGCAGPAELCRGQGFRRAAPSPSHRSQDRNVPGAPDSQVQEGRVILEMAIAYVSYRLSAAAHPVRALQHGCVSSEHAVQRNGVLHPARFRSTHAVECRRPHRRHRYAASLY